MKNLHLCNWEGDADMQTKEGYKHKRILRKTEEGL